MIAGLGLRQRLWLLLSGLTASLLLASAVILSLQTLDPGADQLANLVHATATAFDHAQSTASTDEVESALRQVGVVLRASAPNDEIPRAPVGVAVLAKLRALRPGVDTVRFETGPPTRLWLRANHHGTRWIGIPVQPLGRPIARASLWILLFGGAAVLVSGAWFARSLSRPLEQLARRAPELMAGDVDLRDFRNAPSEVRDLAQTLAHALEQVRTRHARREQMLVGLSHDLRTPLARLRFAIEMGDHNDENARSSMQNDIAEMDALIGAFLLLQREDREEVETAFDLCVLLHETAQGFRARGEVDVRGADHPLPIRARRLALKRAISNLLQNAFAHGREPISIEVTRVAARVRIEIIDGGHHDSSSPTTAGYGLGLGVVRTIVAMHAGTTTFEFGERGSRACLELPLQS